MDKEEKPLTLPPKTEVANMEAFGMHGVLDKIPDWHPMGIPVGAAAQGAIIAGVGDALSGLIARFVPITSGQYGYAIVKALEIIGLNWKPVKGFLGSKSVDNGSVIIAYEGLLSLYNIRAKVYGTLAGVVGKIPGGGSAVAAAAGTDTTDTVDIIP